MSLVVLDETNLCNLGRGRWKMEGEGERRKGQRECGRGGRIRRGNGGGKKYVVIPGCI